MAATLAALVTGAKTKANAQVGGAWSTTEWNDACNRAYEALWIDITDANDTYSVLTANFTLTSASNSVSLTSIAPTFANAIRVLKDPGTAQRQFIRRNPEEQPEGRTFRIEGSLLIIDPLESAPGNYQLVYSPQVTQMTGVIDMDLELAQHREYVELKAACDYLDAEEDHSDALYLRWQETQKRAIAWACGLRSSEPQLVRDVRPRWRNPRLYPF